MDVLVLPTHRTYLVWHRDADDHVNWLLEHGWHEKALAAVQAGKARKELLDEVVQEPLGK